LKVEGQRSSLSYGPMCFGSGCAAAGEKCSAVGEDGGRPTFLYGNRNWELKFEIRFGLSHRKFMFFVNKFLLGMRIMGLGRF
jgi:hypothetical protein